MGDLWDRFKDWLFGTGTIVETDYWGDAMFEIISDTSNEKCRLIDVKLTGDIRGVAHTMTQRVVLPISIVGAHENFDMLAEILNGNVLYPWIDSIIKAQDGVDEVVP